MLSRLARRAVKVGSAGIAGLAGVSLYLAPPADPPERRTAADAVIVGFGLAGGCCALEAAAAARATRSGEQKRILVLDRFDGGGASIRSGGVIYAGGGTAHQQIHGVKDSPEQMEAYLRAELGQDMGVSEAELHDFCTKSIDNLSFLEKLGANFSGELCKYKTSYPTDKFTLYFSGSESAAPFKDITPPVPRGHRAAGDYLTGHNVFESVRTAVMQDPAIKVHIQTSVEKLIVDDDKRVVGVRATTVSGSNKLVRGLHHVLMTLSSTPFPANLATPVVRWLETSFGENIEIWVTQGVVLCAGGYNFSSAMLDKHSPAYKGCGPLGPIGTVGDNGRGIMLGEQAGGATKLMHRCSGWKFINPPPAFLRGVLVTGEGNRMGNEDVYGARLVDRLVEDHGGKGWLIIDQSIWDAARAALSEPDSFVWFQKMNAYINLYWNYQKASSVSELEKMCKIPEGVLQKTIATYNVNSEQKEDPEFRKAPDFMAPLATPPFYAINYAQSGNAFVTMFITLGGLSVSPQSQVLHRETGKPIAGLYAAGRNACGLPSSSYVSGLSLADCVWSGRRAGRAIMAAE